MQSGTKQPPVRLVEDYEVEFANAAGETKSGSFRIRALDDPEDRWTLRRVKANVTQVPWEHLDSTAQMEAESIALLSLMLQEGPAWFRTGSPAELAKNDPALVIRLGVLCAEHNRSFRGGPGAPGGADAGRAKVSVRRAAEAAGA